MSDIPSPSTKIELAHEPAFRLGKLLLKPSTREMLRDDGPCAVLEPRVMQVLVALVQAEGHVVSRDLLTQRCWEGRVVGEDAINRVMSRLRRLAEGLGSSSFRIETITKVGFRLVPRQATAVDTLGSAPLEDDRPEQNPPARRQLVIGGVLLVTAMALGIGAERLLRHSSSAITPQATKLVDQALLALRQSTREGANQAIGLLQRVVMEYPDVADGWGALATTYAYTARYRARAEATALRHRSLAAAARAEALEPGNAFAAIGRAAAGPSRKGWLRSERVLQRALTVHPNHEFVIYALAMLHAEVGRNRECASALKLLRRRSELNPGLLYTEIMATWSAEPLEAVDRLIDEASQIYPSHVALWFARLYVQLYSGRAAQALVMIEDVSARPTGLAAAEFVALVPVVKAMLSREEGDIDAGISIWMARAKVGSGYAVIAAQFASALGRIDAAFALLHAFYFNREYVIPEVSFSVEQGVFSPLNERPTAFLFSPSMASVRKDPRFAVLTRDLGLEEYWRSSGHSSDVAII